MKNINVFFSIVTCGTLFCSSTMLAQTDSVRVRTSTSETVTTGTQPAQPAPVQTQTVVTPAPAPAPAPAATEEPKEERPNLRKTELGFRYYPTFSRLRVRDTEGATVEGEVSMSNGFGAFIGHNFNHHVGLILEVDYNEFSQKYKDRNLDRQVNVSYLNIPVLLSLNTDKAHWVNWNFVVGPQFGVNIGSSVNELAGDSVRVAVGAKGGDVGIAYGTGLEFALNKEHTVRLDVGYRGFNGLVDMSANKTNNNPDTYSVLLSARRQYNAAYIGLTFMF
jgi:hypothetical protein